MRLGSLVDHLLLLARSDAGTLRVHDRPVDLDDVLADVLSSTRPAASSVRTQGVEPVQVTGDAALLEQVLRNLVENAVRHAVSTVDVSLSRTLGTAVAHRRRRRSRHRAESDRAEVFHRFVRLDDSRDRSRGGVGLGLAIVAEIVRDPLRLGRRVGVARRRCEVDGPPTDRRTANGPEVTGATSTDVRSVGGGLSGRTSPR